MTHYIAIELKHPRTARRHEKLWQDYVTGPFIGSLVFDKPDAPIIGVLDFKPTEVRRIGSTLLFVAQPGSGNGTTPIKVYTPANVRAIAVQTYEHEDILTRHNLIA